MTQISYSQSLIDSPEINDDALAEINLILEMSYNFSMATYKDKCMKRRIAIRMRLSRCIDVTSYCNLLRQSEQEQYLLKKALTIHVSQFYRNPSMFEKLRTDVLPPLFHNAGIKGGMLRFLSLGCAAGEEPYSLAILLKESFASELLLSPVEIRGYDIDTEILQAAVQAEYNEDHLRELPVSYRESYFSPKGARLHLSSDISEMVTFEQQNIMETASFEECQLVLCRNTLIYFTRPDQEKILHGIAQILPSGGILVLGKSETLVGEVRKLFATISPVDRIYCKL